MGEVNPINVYRKNNNDISKGINSPEQPKIKPKGQFKFKLDTDVKIRNGEKGLDGKYIGLVYKDGMTVYYDKVYQKDGYTWVAYTSNSGVRRSVAVGKGNQIWGKNI